VEAYFLSERKKVKGEHSLEHREVFRGSEFGGGSREKIILANETFYQGSQAMDVGPTKMLGECRQ
jgi:hypothetical protein